MNGLTGELRSDGVRFTRAYPTPVADLWSALTEPDRVARWLGRVSGDPRPGGRVTIHFDDGEDVFDILACEPPRLLRARWTHDGVESEAVAELRPDGDGASVLVLEHRLLPPERVPGYAAGWHWHLDALGAVVRGEEPGAWATFDELLERYRAATGSGRRS